MQCNGRVNFCTEDLLTCAHLVIDVPSFYDSAVAPLLILLKPVIFRSARNGVFCKSTNSEHLAHGEKKIILGNINMYF